MYSVYMHTSPDGKKYIGFTAREPEKRWDYGCGYSENKRFSDDIKKYGWSNFEHEILFILLTKEEAEEKEMELIAKHKSNNPEFGYNISSGGKPANGLIHSKETKSKIANSLRGKKHSKERRKNQSRARKKLWENPEYRKRLTEAHSGKQRGEKSPNSKKVYRYNLSRNLLAVYASTGEAERQTGIDRRQIGDCCRGKQKTCCGSTWTYEQL